MLKFQCELPRKDFDISVSMNIPSGSIYTLFGPSGAGKSSILNVMAGFETRANNAFLAVDDEMLLRVGDGKRYSVPPHKRGVVLVEQGASLFPHLTVEENIRYGGGGRQMDSFLHDWIERLHLSSYLKSKPHELSGGLVQRAVLIRAVAVRPRVLLLDEPFSALDWELGHTLTDAILELRDKLGTTVIMVTHQLAQAQRASDTIGVISAGKILQEGSARSLMSAPVSFEVARLLGFTQQLRDSDGRMFAVHPNQVLVGIFPGQGIAVTGTVQRCFPRDGFQRVVVSLKHSDETIEVDFPHSVDLHLNEPISFTIPNPVYL